MYTVMILILAAAAGVFWAGLRVSRIGTIYPGVTAEGIDLSDMEYQDAIDTLMEIGHKKYDGFSVTAQMPLENTLTITGADAKLSYNVDRLAADAWLYGRTEGFFGNLTRYVMARYLGRTDFHSDGALEVTFDEAAVREIIGNAARNIDEQLLESGVEITDSEIRLTKGATGLTIDEEQVFRQFRDAILSGDRDGFVYESRPDLDQGYDFQTLHDDMYADVVSARLLYAPYEWSPPKEKKDGNGNVIPGPSPTPVPEHPERPQVAVGESLPGDETLDFGGAPYLVTESQVGVDFDVAEAEAKWAAAGYGDEVVVPITVTEPEHTTEELEGMLFADNLSKNWTMVRLRNREYCEEVRTSLSGSSKSRISNVKKACEKINDVILMPGQVFSYNDTVGERLDTLGWLPAPAYANGEVKQEYGGGICQVSSTLYNAALYSNLEIVERENHYFQVGYLPWGMDATVSWGWPDFKFRNSQPYPIKIVAWVDDETNECCVQIKGTDVDHTYVLMRFNNWKWYEKIDDTDKVRAIGMEAATWRQVYHDGDDYATTKPISETYEAYSRYHYHDEDIG